MGHFSSNSGPLKMWYIFLLILLSQGTFLLCDFDDEMAVEKLVKSVVEMEAEDLIEEILSLLSNSDLSSNKARLRNGLKNLLKNPQYQKNSAQGNTKKNFPLPNGIIKLLKANMSINEKKKVFEKIFQKVNQLEIPEESQKFEMFESVPREARFTTKE